jgi:PadR family transcriptional regulator AphA
MSHRHLVLGLLAEEPMTGYAIKKRVGKALKSVTHASYGTLYPTLHRLLAEGAIRLQEHPQTRRPVRKVYEITEQGQQELEAWLRRPAETDQVRREFLLKLFLARDLPPDDLRALIRQRQSETQAQIEELCQEQTRGNGEWPANQLWVLEYTLEMHQTELRWLNRLMAKVEATIEKGHETLGTGNFHIKAG